MQDFTFLIELLIYNSIFCKLYRKISTDFWLLSHTVIKTVYHIINKSRLMPVLESSYSRADATRVKMWSKICCIPWHHVRDMIIGQVWKPIYVWRREKNEANVRKMSGGIKVNNTNRQESWKMLENQISPLSLERSDCFSFLCVRSSSNKCIRV